MPYAGLDLDGMVALVTGSARGIGRLLPSGSLRLEPMWLSRTCLTCYPKPDCPGAD